MVTTVSQDLNARLSFTGIAPARQLCYSPEYGDTAQKSRRDQRRQQAMNTDFDWWTARFYTSGIEHHEPKEEGHAVGLKSIPVTLTYRQWQWLREHLKFLLSNRLEIRLEDAATHHEPEESVTYVLSEYDLDELIGTLSGELHRWEEETETQAIGEQLLTFLKCFEAQLLD